MSLLRALQSSFMVFKLMLKRKWTTSGSMHDEEEKKVFVMALKFHAVWWLLEINLDFYTLLPPRQSIDNFLNYRAIYCNWFCISEKKENGSRKKGNLNLCMGIALWKLWFGWKNEIFLRSAYLLAGNESDDNHEV